MIMRGSRGVALIIVLLITALLMALIFEFAYGTRASLRAAVNYRDSERGYYLSRAGVNFAGLLLSDHLKNGRPRDNLEQREWQIVPLTTIGGDAELKVRWEDERAKLSIRSVFRGTPTFDQLSALFTRRGINQSALEHISAWMIEQKRNFALLSELHAFLTDDEYQKVQDVLTVVPVSRINVNTASLDVLQCLGLAASTAEAIVRKRADEPFSELSAINAFPGMTAYIAGQLDVTSNVFKVESIAVVGGYTRQVEAIITRTASGFTVNYWRSL